MSARRWTVTLLAALVALLRSRPCCGCSRSASWHRARRRSSRRRCCQPIRALDNYRTLFGSFGIGRFLANSILVSTLATVLALLFTVPAGYAFAKLRFTGRDATFQPARRGARRAGPDRDAAAVPELKAMGLVNTYAGALVPWLACIFGMFLVRQYACRSPTRCWRPRASTVRARDRSSAASCCRSLTPIIVTLALFVFLGSWNDFMWPLIILTDQQLYTLPVALAALCREHVQDIELMMAGAVITVLPGADPLPGAAALSTSSGLLAGSVKG